MPITELNLAPLIASVHQASRVKIVFVVLLFLLSLTSFICQTEFTSQAYLLGFEEPIALLAVTHGSWWLLWPMQAIGVSLWRTIRRVRQKETRYERLNSNAFLLDHENTAENARQPVLQLEDQPLPSKPVHPINVFKKSIVRQFHNVYHTLILVYEANVNDDKRSHNLQSLVEQNPRISSSKSITRCVRDLVKTPSFRYLAVKTGLISVVLNVAGCTWYAAMAMTYALDVTAIYNCSAFTAYAFAIPLLDEKFSWLKASSVIIAVSGVFIVAYLGLDTTSDNLQYPYRFWGNLLISVGAVMYGYYEVLYKKYTCVAAHLAKVITPRRQLTFSNFVMGLMGLYTLVILFSLLIIAQVTGIHHFNMFNYGEKTGKIWFYVVGSIISNLLFSALFLSLMALTSPVLLSVSSLVTIFLIGVVEWLLFGNALGFSQLLGDALVIAGFIVLTYASWSEISEGNEEDEMESASMYSFTNSENTVN